MSPRLGPMCQVLSLERSFRGCADLQTPRGWVNHRLITWPWSTEYFTTWSALSYCHKADTKMRSPTLRYFLWTPFWQGDGFTWGIWWWCTWYHAMRAQPAYFLMVASSLECSRMSGSIWAEKQILRPPTFMTHMMSSPWGGWNLRRPPMVLRLREQRDHQHRPGDRDKCIPK